jgi:hypothetical protein
MLSILLGRSREQEEIPHGRLGYGVLAEGVWGSGILNTKSMNIALMLKWIWKLYQGAEGLWADLIRAKYGRCRCRALNFGRPSKRSNGYLNLERSTRSTMGGGPSFG